jgi:hypothetical protein
MGAFPSWLGQIRKLLRDFACCAELHIFLSNAADLLHFAEQYLPNQHFSI